LVIVKSGDFMSTIARHKISSRDKSPEITRFIEFMNAFSLDYESLGKEVEMSERSITNYTWNNKPLGGALLRRVQARFNVSIDWLLTGKGEMLLDSAPLALTYQATVVKPLLTGEEQSVYKGERRLVDTRLEVDAGALSDAYVLYAQQVEQALIDMGAESGADYGYLDLIRLAQGHVLAEVNAGVDFKVLQGGG
jgi:hypothetical protein